MLYSTTVSTLLSLEVTFLLSLQFRLLRIVEVTRFGYCKSWGSVSDNIRLWHYQYQIISVSGCGIQIINISLNYKQNLLSQKSLFGMIVVRAPSTDSPLRSAHRRLCCTTAVAIECPLRKTFWDASRKECLTVRSCSCGHFWKIYSKHAIEVK